MPDEAKRKFALVVEDDEAVCRVIVRVLKGGGYDAECVSDATAAFAALATRVPDFILLDVNLPGMNGLDMCRVLRTQAATERTPILLITGEDTPTMRDKAKAAGADGFVAKPFGQGELTARIKVAIHLSRANRS